MDVAEYKSSTNGIRLPGMKENVTTLKFGYLRSLKLTCVHFQHDQHMYTKALKQSELGTESVCDVHLWQSDL